MSEKWYKSDMGHLFGAGLLSSGILLGIGTCTKLSRDAETRRIIAERAPVIEQRDLIGGEKPETYVVIAGARYFSHVGGKSIEDSLRK
jgi:hypothetical protein